MTETKLHPQALVETKSIGAGARVGAFAHVLEGVQLGAGCEIGSHAVIMAGATVGEGVTVGVHATVLPGLTIGPNAVIGAGAVVTRPVPPYAVVVGNPARIVRYADTERGLEHETVRAPSQLPPSIRVDRVQLLHVPLIKDLRGSLSAREVGRGLPFVPNRIFVVFDVPSKEIRGEHAHRQCEQFLICLNGSMSVVCDDGTHRQEFVLDTPELGLYLPPMVWGIQYKYSDRAQLVVLASHGYDAKDYLRNYEEFLAERRIYDAQKP